MSVRVAVEGCCHGELDAIYKSLRRDTELLLICGDFQALRNSTDLQTLNVPTKYLRMGDFHQYYLGEKNAPVLTIFIGGNHECLLYLREIQYGGWVAPNIYYLGEFGVVWFKGLRISGISGIWNDHSYRSALGTPPTYSLPYLLLTIKSIYHVKPKNYMKFLLSGTSDISMTHDWPQWVWKWGDHRRLLRHKPYFKSDMNSGRLGSPLASIALDRLRLRYWFSLHLHTRFTANVKHKRRGKVDLAEKSVNSDEIALDMDAEEPSQGQVAENAVLEHLSSGEEILGQNTVPTTSETVLISDKLSSHQIELDMDEQAASPERKRQKMDFSETTHFLALDKCLPRRRYLEFLLITPLRDSPNENDSNSLYYDSRALAIQKVVEDLVSANPLALDEAGLAEFWNPDSFAPLLEELEESVAYEEKKMARKELLVPLNFSKVAPDSLEEAVPLQYWENGQTGELCEKFQIRKPDLSGK